ncbi:hypothetical protein GPA22_17645 [Aromatoleum toluvorans]|uniref:Uncharacterized protein n=1 Tax=Aromatoleum toluvorans TaxID=92002 RepID=A0ABX1Q1G3_9RHOO|nr:hypothetical protein [Aromatoleum toluvorans]NMG45541.1 hypothetical protein [Aromatoleum toluvorans]
MKISKAFIKCTEFLERQKTLALEFVRPLMRKTEPPLHEARRLIARAIRLIERNHRPHDGAAAVGKMLADVCTPYFGAPYLAHIRSGLRARRYH